MGRSPISGRRIKDSRLSHEFPFGISRCQRAAQVLRRESPASRATPLPQDDSEDRSQRQWRRTRVSVSHRHRCATPNSRGGCSHVVHGAASEQQVPPLRRRVRSGSGRNDKWLKPAFTSESDTIRECSRLELPELRRWHWRVCSGVRR